MDERALELKVGLLAVLALIAGLALWAILQGPFAGGLPVDVDFADAAGLTAGAPVKYAGVTVGRVHAVVLLPQRRAADRTPLPVRVELRLAPSARSALVSDARFTVASQGPLGEPYVELLPGSPDAAPLASGAEVRGIDPVRFDRILDQASRLVTGLGNAVSGNPRAIPDLLAHLDQFVRDADGTLRAVGPALGATATDAAAAAADARALAHEARPLLAELAQKLPALAEHAAATAAKADALVSSVSPGDVAQLRKAAQGAAATATQLQEVAARADRILAGVERGQGTVGEALKDPKVFDDLKALVADLKAHPWKFLWK